MIDLDLYTKMGLRDCKVTITCNEITINEVTSCRLGDKGCAIFSPYPVRVDASQSNVYSKKIEGNVRMFIEGKGSLNVHSVTKAFGYTVITCEHGIKELVKSEL